MENDPVVVPRVTGRQSHQSRPRAVLRQAHGSENDRGQVESRPVPLSPGRCRSLDRTGGEVNQDRRRFLATAAATIVATKSLLHGRGVVADGGLSALRNATTWLNSPPLTAEGLRGKVVLVDFWTYTCINWLRTLPYVRAWAEKYQGRGLVVIGVHTPEFSFEHDAGNVRRAVKDMRVGYPVAID